MFEIKVEKTWFDAIHARSSVRRFTGAPTDEQLLQLGDLCRKFSWQGVRMRLFRGPGMKSFIKGTDVFCALALKKGTAPELVGFYGEALVLEATAMGLGSCWLGMFYHDMVKNTFKPDKEEEVVLLIALGQCDKPAFAPKRKALAELLSGNESDLHPWQKSAFEAARLAPSAVNMQPWRFAFDVRSMSVLSRSTLMGKKYAGYDRGIAMLHATVGAAREGRDGRWQACENGYQFK